MELITLHFYINIRSVLPVGVSLDSKVSPPGWDLTKVLGALWEAPYEPLGEASCRDLTKKTLFPCPWPLLGG